MTPVMWVLLIFIYPHTMLPMSCLDEVQCRYEADQMIHRAHVTAVACYERK